MREMQHQYVGCSAQCQDLDRDERSIQPNRLLMLSAAAMACLATSSKCSAPRRYDGPETLSAATTPALLSYTGAPTAFRPTSSSSCTLPHPLSRTEASSASRSVILTTVFGVNDSSLAPSRLRTSPGSNPASSTFPLDVACAGPLWPTHVRSRSEE